MACHASAGAMWTSEWECRKNMTFGQDTFSYEEVVTRLTWWYHQGDGIAGDDPQGRKLHMGWCPRIHYKP